MLIKKILIGVDNTKYADHAAQYGLDIAHKFRAKVGLVHIIEPVMMPYSNAADPLMGASELGMTDTELLDIQSHNSKAIVDNIVNKYCGDLEVTHFNEYGDTADGIVRCAEEFGADIIVIGTHSRTGIDRLLMGSVAEHVVRHAMVPVLVVPFNEEKENREKENKKG